MNLPRLLLMIAVTPCFVVPSFAASGFTIGGGLNSSYTSADAAGAEFSNRVGFNLGIGYEKEVTPGFSVLPELSLETRGENAKVENTPFGDYEVRQKLLYLQIAYLAMLKAPLAGVTLQVYAGPELGVLLSAEVERGMDGNLQTVDIKDQMTPVDFGIEMGIGVEFPVAWGSIYFRPGYYLGFVNVEDSDTESDYSLRNFKLKLGYKFPL